MLKSILSQVFLLSFYLIGPGLKAQEIIILDSTSFKKILEQIPSFTIHGDNYIISGTSIGQNPTGDNSDAKLQFGFKQRITNASLPWDTYLFFTYKQRSFWEIYKESLPFRETNFNPGLGLVKPFFKNRKLNEIVMVQFEHESNGRDLLYSRGWNFLSIYYMRYLNHYVTSGIKAWVPLGDKSDNEDITEYRGFTNIDFAFKVNNKVIVESEFRKAFSFDWRGSMIFGVSFKIAKKSNQYIYAQYFLGYSEDLINYNQNTQKLRIGIAFKDLLLKFKHR